MAEHHYMYGTPTYKSWSEMKYRCGNIKRSEYVNVDYCKEWVDFRVFLKDMGIRPKGFTLDRINVFKGYYKENCRWADNHTQAINKTNSRYLTLNGITKHISQWSKDTGIKRSTLSARVCHYGWSDEKALTTKAVK